MEPASVLALAGLVFAAAALYASVGHGGASGYLAAMALIGVAPEAMRPAALALNVLVAGIGTVTFYRAGQFSWAHLWPFAALSVPAAFVGGAVSLPVGLYRPVVGAVLLYAAVRLLRQSKGTGDTRPLPMGVALAAGAVIGLLSGLVGVGGGIFLSPLLVLTRWVDVRTASGVAAAPRRAPRSRRSSRPWLGPPSWAGGSGPSWGAAGSRPRSFAARWRSCSSWLG